VSESRINGSRTTRARGFSLLELLVAMALVALLTALALPAYAALVQRAQRNDARLALLAIQHAEELHYQDANAYTEMLSLPRADGGLGLRERSDAGLYELTVSTSGDGQHFMATARPVPGTRQAGDTECALLILDETGRRSATDAGNRDSSAQCWR
jgi:type IV pilus assembly protein PilE